MRKRRAALGALGVLSTAVLSGFMVVHSRRTRNVAKLLVRFTYWLGEVDGEMAGRLNVGADKAVPAEKLFELIRFSHGVTLKEGGRDTIDHVWLEASFITRDNKAGRADVYVKGDPLSIMTLHRRLKNMRDIHLAELRMDDREQAWLAFVMECPTVNAITVGRRISEEQERVKATQNICAE